MTTRKTDRQPDLADQMRDEMRRRSKSIALLGPVETDEMLMLARDGSDRVEAMRGATSIAVGKALSDSEGGTVPAFINPTPMYLTPSDGDRLRRIVEAMR